MLLGRSAGISSIAGAAIVFLGAISGSGALPGLQAAVVDTYPAYSAQGIVNTASQTAEALAPNSIATLYGTNLAFSTSAASAQGGVLPTELIGVTVYVDGRSAHLFYVSPGQINFLIPYDLVPGILLSVQVARDGAAGPAVKITLNSASPGLFPWNGNLAIATHLSGALLSPDSPAKAGEIIILYAEGLGWVNPDTTSGRLAQSAAAVLASAKLQVMLAGTAIPAGNILYAGLAPGYAGLYQINVRLPDMLPANPEIRVTAGGATSHASIHLPALATAPPADN